MGTTWHVTVVQDANTPDPEVLRSGIAVVLANVDAMMSTYRDDSEISRVNAAPTEQWVQVSPPFMKVLSAALSVGAKSGGAYDVTVAPLVNLWGFGPGPDVFTPPSDAAIAAARSRVGQGHILFDEQRLAVQKMADLALDFSSIAKGYGVDRVADWLEAQGIGRYLVEVGGEMRLAGMSARGDAWHVAIERPDASKRAVAIGVAVTDNAVATSGDYRNYFEFNGRRFSHSIDPRTGYPVAHDLVSVTVIHPSAMLADAWATALTVLGESKAMALAQEQGLAVYFIRRVGDDYVASHSAAYEPYLHRPT